MEGLPHLDVIVDVFLWGCSRRIAVLDVFVKNNLRVHVCKFPFRSVILLYLSIPSSILCNAIYTQQ